MGIVAHMEGLTGRAGDSAPKGSAENGTNWGSKAGGGHEVFLVDAGEPSIPGTLATVRLWKMEKKVCRNALFCLSVENPVRKAVLTMVFSPFFDNFILMCILLNSLMLVCYQYRGSPTPQDNDYNKLIVLVGDILTWVFTLECVLKIIALGMFYEKGTYLRDSWNVLDFVVVVSGAVELLGIGGGGLGFLRLFRVLRPLRSLNRVPEMKKLVNTSISAVPRLSNVAIMGVFLFTIFAIIGMTFFRGVFYRRCHATPNPTLDVANGCWAWDYAESAGRLCGGDYTCEINEYCKGHEQDLDDDLRPLYNVSGVIFKVIKDTGYNWCENAAPAKWSMIGGEVSGSPETDQVHFDHIGGAFLLIFQCMTLEGWTDLMYYVGDSYGAMLAWSYFILLVIVTSFLLLNVALAVVDEALDSFSEDEEEEEEGEEVEEEKEEEEEDEKEGLLDSEAEENYCMNIAPVRVANKITQHRAFQDGILMVIVANVIVMTWETYPANLGMERSKRVFEDIFLVIFTIEMLLELLARGPKGYALNPFTCFDGVVVVLAIIGKIVPVMNLSMLRTLRLFRVLLKIAKKQPKLGVLIKAMLGTARALKYWSVLFLLVLYIFTLMMMTFYSNRFHFEDPDSFAKNNIKETADGDAIPWCPGTETLVWNDRQECIPRANFDTFTWGFVTVFQIMTGENWNTIMYAAMRTGGSAMEAMAAAIVFVILILFGQTLFLSLFLSMLINSYSEIQDKLEESLITESSKILSSGKTKDLGDLTKASSKQSADSADEQTEKSPVTPLTAGDLRDLASPTNLPGQIQTPPEDSPNIRLNTSEVKAAVKSILDHEDDFDPQADDKAQEIPSTRKWPYGYSWFVLHETNPIRVLANKALKAEIKGVNVFDNGILVCILISTLCMMYDHPSADRTTQPWMAINFMQKIFACIFIAEMCVKLFAFPLLWGPKAYLKDAWNILDAIVVAVSILDFMPGFKGPSFLKVLRILRALRPLRVINRNENLKLVVETIFKSMIELGWLLVVMLLFTLIFALVGVSELKGHFYACEGDGIAFLRMANGTDYASELSLRTPLCISNTINTVGVTASAPGGAWNDSVSEWQGECGAGFTAAGGATGYAWQRGSIDTPICVAQCNPGTQTANSNLCPRRYENAHELPNNCEAGTLTTPVTVQEQIGYNYVLSQQARYILPCAGSTIDSVAAGAAHPLAGVSCKNLMCPTVEAGVAESCKDECSIHPDFCVLACDSEEDQSPKCQHCREECQAACECPDFCTPYIKDSALCYEQGGIWVNTASQNFNNVANAMLGLFEISTTEGWVDVMYAATDAVGVHMQPLRDTSTYFWAPFFVLWIFLSFMFLVNLAVGIIADKFMDERDKNSSANGGEFMLTDWQRKWKKTRQSLYCHAQVYEVENLTELEPLRRAIYHLIGCDRSGSHFEKFIMACIVVNTMLMGLGVFPQPWPWFDNVQKGLNFFFAFAFTIEAILKGYVLRRSYFRNNWNKFDFFCVISTLLGIVISEATPLNIRTITSVIRIFRIARLFRLLRFLKELNKIFMALVLSLPGLVNVVLVLLLLLILFSILGVQLFGTVKQGDTLNQHGNFKDFTFAFTTLFRASTGEAWNEIMHDLAKGEKDFFRMTEPSWCTPSDFFDLDADFQVLKDKCLLSHPNTCVQNIGGWNVLPYAYWVGYILLIGLVVLNLLITVILAGYAEGKQSGEEENDIETCKALWGEKYDPNHTMSIGYKQAIEFINEALPLVIEEGLEAIVLPENPLEMPLKVARAFDINVPPGGEDTYMVHFREATRQILRLAAIIEGGQDLIQHLDETDDKMSSKDKEKLLKMEMKNGVKGGIGDGLAKHLATSKLQKLFREWKARKIRREAVKEMESKVDEAQDTRADQARDADREARWASVPKGISPPIAG